MTKGSVAKTAWQVLVIILLNVVLIAAAQASSIPSSQQTDAEPETQATLSKMGSRGEEVRKICLLYTSRCV